MGHRILFHPLAAEDLDGIDELIGRDSPERAHTFVQKIREQCLRLSEYPERGVPRPDLHPGLRTVSIERRVLIAYRAEKDQVVILRVFYGGQFFGADDIPD